MSYLLSFSLGAISVLAFAPFHAYQLVFICLAGLMHLLVGVNAKQALGLGFSFGLGMYLFGVSWVYVSLSVYGGMPLWMGSIAVLGFVSLLALFTGLATFIASWVAKGSKTTLMCVLPFAWVVAEWCKSWVLTGFPWLDIAYTQTPSWLMAWAPVGGVYLVSFVVIVVSILVFYLCQTRSVKVGIALLSIIGVSFGIDQINWTQPVGSPINVGVVQANVPIEEKWQEQTRRNTIAQYRDLSAALAAEDSMDLIVWPETALPLYATQTDEAFWQTMAPERAAVVTGLLDYDGKNSYNAAALSCAENRAEPQLYRKRHLVPFGEYQPLKFLFAWVFEYLQLPMSDFIGWQGQQTLSCDGGINVGLSICYEDAFSNEYRAHLGDATLLLNISEDAWFGDSFAPHQRTQLAQMRAAELGRPLVRAANSGPSLFINEKGQLEEETEQFQVATTARKVQAMTGNTPFITFGSWIVWLSLLLMAYFAFRKIKT